MAFGKAKTALSCTDPNNNKFTNICLANNHVTPKLGVIAGFNIAGLAPTVVVLTYTYRWRHCYTCITVTIHHP